MIPSKSMEITTTGDLGGKVTPMTISAEHMPHIVKILTHQYSDIILAILREYSANAWDSHVAAGKTDTPIQVRTPNKLHPFLEIEDFGVGMSVDFVEGEFSRYGASTKRITNEEIGAFGIGGKSALAYTDSFTLRTRKDGVESNYVVGYNEDGAAIITTMAIYETDKPSGTLISIPAKGNRDFDEKVDWFYKFWEPGTVLVNDKAPRRIEAESLTEDVYFVPGGGQSYVVMGNIPYRVAYPEKYNRYYSSFAFVFYVPIGSVTVTPSREALEYGDDNTVKTLMRVGDVFQAEMKNKITKDILSRPTHFEAWERWDHWRGIVGEASLKGLKYKGDEFVGTVDLPKGWSWRPGQYRSMKRTNYNHYYHTRPSVKDLKCVILKDKTDKTPWDQPTSYQRKKARLFRTSKGLGGATIYFLDEVPTSPWIQGMNVFRWSDVKAVKDPNVVARTRRPSGQVPVMTIPAFSYFQDIDIDSIKGPVYLVTPQDSLRIQWTDLIPTLAKMGKSVTVVKLSAHRWDKFTREHNVQGSITSYLRDLVKIEHAAVTKQEWDTRGLRNNTKAIIKKLKPDLVLDPELQGVIKSLKFDLNKWDEVFALATSFGGDMPPSKRTEDWVRARYPLIKTLESWTLEADAFKDLYVYMNSKYKETHGTV